MIIDVCAEARPEPVPRPLPDRQLAASALIERAGRFLWACAPRVDGDPVFCALLGRQTPAAADAQGL